MPTKPSKQLETFDNPHPQRDYIIEISSPEFTCLCPKTGQPDFAEIQLYYVPDRKCVELKSLKLYYWSFRDEGAFHEDVSNTILDDLVAATEPRYMRLRARFYVRGGIYTTVEVEYRKPGWIPGAPPPDNLPRETQDLPTREQIASAAPADHTPAAAEPPRPQTSALAPDDTPPEPELAETLSPETLPEQGVDGYGSLDTEATDDTGDTEPQIPVQEPAMAAATNPEQDDAICVGIDVGSSGCRCAAIDTQGVLLAQAQAPIAAPMRSDSQVTQDPTLWWKAVLSSLGELLQQIDATRVRAMAVDGTSSTLLLCDSQGKPVTPAMMYQDARAQAQAQTIAEIADPQSGAHGATSALAKLLWLQTKGLDKKAAHALHQADWINGMLSGQWGHSDYNNCLKLGFDAQQGSWPAWFAQLGVNEAILPSVHAPGEALGPINAELAEKFGLRADTQIITGSTDGVAAFIAAGANEAGEAVTSLGSTLVLKLLSESAIYSAEHGVYSHKLGRHWLAGGASNSGGAVLLQYFKPEQMQDMSLMIDPDNLTDMDYYPLPAIGERFPVNDPDMEARLEPLPGDSVTFFQAILEGIANIEARGYALLTELGAPALTSVRSTGGGSKNQAWTRLRGNILGVPMIQAQSKLSAYGTALIAQGVIAKTYD